jgi:hypothetical protein
VRLDDLIGGTFASAQSSATAGGEIVFGFDGLDETIVMRVDRATAPASVTWTCLVHTADPDWDGTSITFDLAERNRAGCLLTVRHHGLAPSGWDHFLSSLASYAAHSQGTPYAA